jgi:alkylhydroperoxidase family enzyme
MARIEPRDLAGAPADIRAAADAHQRLPARITNMKRTLLHSLPAFDALMTWYPLRDRVAAFLGERATLILAHAISVEADCLICSTFFRRILIERGENPDRLILSEAEATLAELGRRLATPPHEIPDDLYARVAEGRSDEQVVDLMAFAAIMLATNVFNNALEIPLDHVLEPFRRGAPHGSI